MKHRYWMLAAGLAFMAGQVHGVTFGQLDDFNDGTSQGWSHGPVSPNPPVVVFSGGPDGSVYLENFSSGNSGPGGKHIILNQDPRWTGDYLAAGINKIRVDIANFGAEPLPMRLAFLRIDVDCWASTVPQIVPPDATWRNYEFIIEESTMTSVFAMSSTFADAMRNVDGIRLMAATAPGCSGDQLLATSGYDNMRTTADSDLDGIDDDIDNCTLVHNPDQRDTNTDGHGNVCDFDYTNDCVVNFLDLGPFSAAFGSIAGDEFFIKDVDFNGDGVINFFDFGTPPNNFAGFFMNPPGPSATACQP